MFGSALETACQFAEILATDGVQRGLIGPRETPRLWDRHLLNCAVVAELLPESGELVDIGSGAGLPGIPIAIVRPEIRVTLGESQGKKTVFLREAVRTLGLNAEVFDQRIEQMAANRVFDAVTLRAVDRMTEACRAGADRVRAGGWLVVFATAGTEESLKPIGAGIDWARRLGIAGLDDGLLLLGRKR